VTSAEVPLMDTERTLIRQVEVWVEGYDDCSAHRVGASGRSIPGLRRGFPLKHCRTPI